MQSADLVREVEVLARRALAHSAAWQEVIEAARYTLRSKKDLASTMQPLLRTRMHEVNELLVVVEDLQTKLSDGHRKLISESLELHRLFILASLAKDNRSAIKAISLQTMQPARAEQASIPSSSLLGPLQDGGETFRFLPTDLRRQSYSPSDCCDKNSDQAVLGAGSFGTVYRMLRSDAGSEQPDVVAVKVHRICNVDGLQVRQFHTSEPGFHAWTCPVSQ